MTTKHTPTPWALARFAPEMVYSASGVPISQPHSTAAKPCFRETNEENAAFIVRACNSYDDLVTELCRNQDILEVLLERLDILGSHQNKMAIKAINNQIKNNAEALAKAKGES